MRICSRATEGDETEQAAATASTAAAAIDLLLTALPLHPYGSFDDGSSS